MWLFKAQAPHFRAFKVRALILRRCLPMHIKQAQNNKNAAERVNVLKSKSKRQSLWLSKVMIECWIDSERALPGTMSRKNWHDHRTQFQFARKQIWTSDGRISNTLTKKSYAPQTNIDLTNSKQICYCSNKQIQQRKKLAQLLFNFQMTQTFVGGCRKQRRHTMAMDYVIQRSYERMLNWFWYGSERKHNEKKNHIIT